MSDVGIWGHGSVIILSANTIKGREWLAEHLPEDAPRWGKEGYVVETRYLQDIIDGAAGDGIEIS